MAVNIVNNVWNFTEGSIFSLMLYFVFVLAIYQVTVIVITFWISGYCNFHYLVNLSSCCSFHYLVNLSGYCSCHYLVNLSGYYSHYYLMNLSGYCICHLVNLSAYCSCHYLVNVRLLQLLPGEFVEYCSCHFLVNLFDIGLVNISGWL